MYYTVDHPRRTKILLSQSGGPICVGQKTRTSTNSLCSTMYSDISLGIYKRCVYCLGRDLASILCALPRWPPQKDQNLAPKRCPEGHWKGNKDKSHLNLLCVQTHHPGHIKGFVLFRKGLDLHTLCVTWLTTPEGQLFCSRSKQVKKRRKEQLNNWIKTTAEHWMSEQLSGWTTKQLKDWTNNWTNDWINYWTINNWTND